MNNDAYQFMTNFLKKKDIHLEKYMFRAVLKSFKRRIEGDSARSANEWAYVTELIGYVGDGTANHPEDKSARKELAQLTKEIYAAYCKEVENNASK